MKKSTDKNLIKDGYFWRERNWFNKTWYIGITPKRNWIFGIMLGRTTIDVSLGCIHFGIWF